MSNIVVEEPIDQNSILAEKVKAMQNLIEIQGQKIGHDMYMIGIYNGLVLGLSVLTGEEPKFYEMEDNNNGKV